MTEKEKDAARERVKCLLLSFEIADPEPDELAELAELLDKYDLKEEFKGDL